MNKLFIPQDVYTPLVDFDADQGSLKIKGVSTPENSPEFFTRIMEWLETYIASPANETTLELQLDYYNTSTASVLMQMFTMFQNNSKDSTKIKWVVEEDDDDYIQAGSDYAELFDGLEIETVILPVEE